MKPNGVKYPDALAELSVMQREYAPLIVNLLLFIDFKRKLTQLAVTD